MRKKVLIVGAGFAGSVIARELAEAGIDVRVIDRRDHLGGNAFDYSNDYGERIHQYGPHLLHGDKNSIAVRWLSRFTEWVPYEHRVRALLPSGQTTPLPVNRTTLEDVFGIPLHTELDAKKLLNKLIVKTNRRNTDEIFLSSVGVKLADLFFRPYTRKMWGISPQDLEAAVGARLPVRTCRDDRYFTDTFQAMPKDGYSKLFDNILDHKNIQLDLGVAYNNEPSSVYSHQFLSVSIDEYFNYCYGRLPYRSVRFEQTTQDRDQSATVINYTDDGPYTRITQWDLISNSKRRSDGLHTCTREVPCSAKDNNYERYYPVRNEYSLLLLKRYQELAESQPHISFIGRTGLFRYIDMIPCIDIHLQIASRYLKIQMA